MSRVLYPKIVNKDNSNITNSSMDLLHIVRFIQPAEHRISNFSPVKVLASSEPHCSRENNMI